VGKQAIDETGHRYGKLVVIERAANKGKKAAWFCKCDCGNEFIVSGVSLRRGTTKNCGCFDLPYRIKNEVGNQYGRLTVLGWQGLDKFKSALWLCRCDCGNETIVRGNSLRQGDTRSCGCLQKERAHETFSLPSGVAAFNTLIRTMKRGARQRGYIWQLTKEQVRILTQQSCYYCGAQPIQQGTSSACNGAYLYNGLDRVNNERGYEINNVIPCCGICNYAKRTMTQDDFLAWISRVYNHSVDKEK